MGTRSPFLTIWLQPRQTIRAILCEDPKRYVLPIAIVLAIHRAYDQAAVWNLGDQYSLLQLSNLIIASGVLLGCIFLWLYPRLIRWPGKLLGGIASSEHLATALTWACIPSVMAAVFRLPEFFIIGDELFTTETPRLDSDSWRRWVSVGLAITRIALHCWSLVLICQTVAEVQGFRSAWKGFANLLLAMIVFVVFFIFPFAAVKVYINRI